MVTLAEFAAALITVFEGERLTAYLDSGGVPTIGIGHTSSVIAGDVITHEQAIALFAIEAAALASFGFNCGRGALAKVLAGGDLVSNPVHTTDRHGKVLAGLVARRRLEETLIALSQDMSPRLDNSSEQS